jgi:hypothetical protein
MTERLIKNCYVFDPMQGIKEKPDPRVIEIDALWYE